MSSRKTLESLSIGDENTPYNSQDQNIAQFSKYQGQKEAEYILPGCDHEVLAESRGEEVWEEATLRETDYCECSEPINKGEDFRRISSFLDSECGKPVTAQHLRIDFTPREGVDDDEYIFKKCCEFWKLIDNTPSIKGLQALPSKLDDVGLKNISSRNQKLCVIQEGKHVEPLPACVGDSRRSDCKKQVKKITKVEPTAIDWLKHQEIVGEAFVTKNEQRYYEDGKVVSQTTIQDQTKRLTHRYMWISALLAFAAVWPLFGIL